jgi:anti-sigma factor RsiW
MIKNFQSTACREFEASLEDYLEGELRGPEAARLSEHLKTCARCRAALDLASLTIRLLSAGEPTADPGPGFSRLVMARIRLEQQRAGEKGIWLPFVSVAWRFAAAASLTVIALITYTTTLHPVPQQNIAQVRGAQSRDLVTDAGGPPESRDEILMMMAETNHGKH